jgi:cell wall-associated NlpC family hydrolase
MEGDDVMYNRERAVAYANTYWNSHNPAFRFFRTDDCTNFISQCLYAGGFPMVGGRDRAKGWWYRQGRPDNWSYSWAVANSFYWFLRSRAQQVLRVEDLQLGDVICYDFEGDGRWNHSAIVTYKDENGQAYVNAHTNNSQYRYWPYQDSAAWTPRIKYAFFHIR